MPPMPQCSVKYNLRWPKKTKSTSVIAKQELCATYKRKMLSVLKANKALVRALSAAKVEIAELKATASRWGKIEELYLPMLKGWVDTNVGPIRALFDNHVRVSTFLKDLLTPDANITLTAASSLLHEAGGESPARKPASLHPPGSHLHDRAHCMSMVLEEDDEDRTEALEPLEAIPETPQPEISRSSRVTVRKKGRRSDRLCSLPADEPLAADADQSPVLPSFAVVDEEASILVTEITGEEKVVVCAETVVMPPPSKLRDYNAHEYSAAFSHRPKIPRTPCSPTKRDARLNARLGDDGASPALARVQRRRASEAALLLCPGKRASAILPRRKSCTPGSIAQVPLGRRSSMPAAREGGPGAADGSLLPSQSVLDEAFVESPSPTQVFSRNTLLPKEVADFQRDENSPPNTKTLRRESTLKSRPSEGGRKKAPSHKTSFAQKGRTQTAGDATDDVAIPPAQSVDERRERGGRGSPEDGGGGTQQRCSAPLDVVGPLPRRSSALHPKQGHCVDEKPPQARKSRAKQLQGKQSQGFKKTAVDLEESAPPPQPADRSSLSVGGGSPARMSSGRPARSAAKSASYKEPNLIVKLRRP